MLTAEQKARFETFGFLQLRQAFSPEETVAITEAFDDVLAEDRGGTPFEGKGQSVWAVVEQQPVLSRIVEDDRIFEPVEQMLGSGFIWAGSEGNVTARAEHTWHADRAGESEAAYPRIKVMLYLDPTTDERGALRVIPGSHRDAFHEDLLPLQAQHSDSGLPGFGVDGPRIPSLPVESQPGDVVLFFQSLFHAVYNGFAGRRYIALKFAARPTADEHFASLARYTPEIFDPDPGFLNSTRPRIRQIVDPLLELRGKAPKQPSALSDSGMSGPARM